tara:strand:- start:1847 stop:2155 length:309 start_codon:yes stop_codon:yes gene_type:complete
MTLDDFEWVEWDFDKWTFIHKTHQLTAAKVYSYKGWHVVVTGMQPDEEIVVESFDAAKVIATLMVAQQIERFPDATRYGKRVKTIKPGEFPEGIFGMGHLRR